MKLSESGSDDEDFGIENNGGVSTDSIAKVSSTLIIIVNPPLIVISTDNYCYN